MKYKVRFVLASLSMMLLLCGCAGGAVLVDKPTDLSRAAFIEIPSDERFWIRPIHDDAKAEVKIGQTGIWVTEGWFLVEDQCFSPKNQKDMIVTFEDDDFETIKVKSGHRYKLQCDPDVVAKINLIEE